MSSNTPYVETYGAYLLPMGSKLVSSVIYQESKVFQRIGAIMTVGAEGTKPKINHIFQRISKLSKPATKLLTMLIDNRIPETNITAVTVKSQTSSQKAMLSVRLKELKTQNLICVAKTIDKTKPIPKGSFMINPYQLGVYQTENEELACNAWKYYTGKTE